jgi:RNA polymerase sigma factor (sigma-70 family)
MNTPPNHAQVTARGIYNETSLRHALLSAERERELLIKAQAGDAAAFDEIVNANQRLVAGIAGRYLWITSACIDYLDLIQYGNEGLLKAITKYDPARGMRFSTMAVPWIRLYVRRFGLVNSTTITPSFRASEDLARVNSKVQGPHDLPKSRTADLHRLSVPASLDTEEGVALHLSVPSAADHIEYLDIYEAVRRLNPRRRVVVTMSFWHGMSNREIGEALGVTHQAISQVMAQALFDLKRALK